MAANEVAGYFLILMGVILIFLRSMKLGMIMSYKMRAKTQAGQGPNWMSDLIKAIKDPLMLVALVMIVLGAALISPSIFSLG